MPRGATLQNMKRGRVCRRVESGKRAVADHECGKAASGGKLHPVPLLGGRLPRVQPGSYRDRATTTG